MPPKRKRKANSGDRPPKAPKEKSATFDAASDGSDDDVNAPAPAPRRPPRTPRAASGAHAGPPRAPPPAPAAQPAPLGPIAGVAPRPTNPTVKQVTNVLDTCTQHITLLLSPAVASDVRSFQVAQSIHYAHRALNNLWLCAGDHVQKEHVRLGPNHHMCKVCKTTKTDSPTTFCQCFGAVVTSSAVAADNLEAPERFVTYAAWTLITNQIGGEDAEIADHYELGAACNAKTASL